MNFTPTLPAGRPLGGAVAGSGGALSQADQEQQMINYVSLRHPIIIPVPQLTIKQWKGISESCPFKMVLSGGMGFAMGGAFGLFMSSVRPLSPSLSPPKKTEYKHANLTHPLPTRCATTRRSQPPNSKPR